MEGEEEGQGGPKDLDKEGEREGDVGKNLPEDLVKRGGEQVDQEGQEGRNGLATSGDPIWRRAAVAANRPTPPPSPSPPPTLTLGTWTCPARLSTMRVFRQQLLNSWGSSQKACSSSQRLVRKYYCGRMRAELFLIFRERDGEA